MLVQTHLRLLSASTGESERGKWYSLSGLAEDTPYQFRCTEDVFHLAKNLEFGQEVTATIDFRLYDRNWFPRVINIEM